MRLKIRLKKKKPAKLGGVDFRSMPAVVMAGKSQAADAQNAGAAAAVAIVPMDANELDKRWAHIQQIAASGQMPYDELCSYLSACCANNDSKFFLDKAMLWISEVLKMEEDACITTSPKMKDVIALL